MTQLFNSPFYHTTIDYTGKSKLIEQIQSRYNLSPTYKPNSWGEDVHTSIVYQKCDNNIEYFKKSNIPIDLVIEIDRVVQKSVEQFGVEDLGKFYIAEMWYNAYKNRQYQHMHDHSNNNNMLFSGIYYMKYNEKQHSATRFYNPHFKINYDKTIIQKNSFFVKQPEIKENDVFIFPSNVVHDVLPQESDDLRITIAFNVALLNDE